MKSLSTHLNESFQSNDNLLIIIDNLPQYVKSSVSNKTIDKVRKMIISDDIIEIKENDTVAINFSSSIHLLHSIVNLMSSSPNNSYWDEYLSYKGKRIPHFGISRNSNNEMFKIFIYGLLYAIELKNLEKVELSNLSKLKREQGKYVFNAHPSVKQMLDKHNFKLQ